MTSPTKISYPLPGFSQRWFFVRQNSENLWVYGTDSPYAGRIFLEIDLQTYLWRTLGTSQTHSSAWYPPQYFGYLSKLLFGNLSSGGNSDRNNLAISFPALQVGLRWFICSHRTEQGKVIYANLCINTGITFIEIDFHKCTWRRLQASDSSERAFPFLEGASGLSTLLYAIELQLFSQ